MIQESREAREFAPDHEEPLQWFKDTKTFLCRDRECFPQKSYLRNCLLLNYTTYITSILLLS